MNQDQQAAPKKRISFAGCVYWRRSGKTAKSVKQQFISTYDAIRQVLEQETPATQETARKWKAVRISEPGKYFWGFARR
jgi:hypothetical protein